MSYPHFFSKGDPYCTSADPDAFFPETEISGSIARANQAKKVCHGSDTSPACPYITECLEWAIENNEPGIWGGTSWLERKAIVQERARPRARSLYISSISNGGI